MLAFSIDYYGMIFRATQSVELFCAYNKKPDEIIYFELCEKPFYFWYYENFQSDKSGKSLSIEIER